MTASEASVSQAAALETTSKTRWTTRLGNYLLGANASLIYAFLYLPVLILIIFSFNNTRSVAVFTGFSFEWYQSLVQNEDLLDAARNSLLVGLVATLVSTVVGTLLALGMDRFKFRGSTSLDANLYLPIVIPEIVMGISLLLFFNQALFPLIDFLTGYRPTTGLHTITISHIAFNIPFVYIIVRARLADFDRTLEEAAQDLGADIRRTFLRVTLPLLTPGIIGGALLAFTLSLDDYLITVFTKGVQSQTMPLYIYSLVRRGVTPEINALSTALLLGSIALVGLSLGAQSGVSLYTRSISLGARAGIVVYGVFHLWLSISSGPLALSLIIYLLLTLLPFLKVRSLLMDWREDLREANFTGALLSLVILLVVLGATFLSLRILFL